MPQSPASCGPYRSAGQSRSPEARSMSLSAPAPSRPSEMATSSHGDREFTPVLARRMGLHAAARQADEARSVFAGAAVRMRSSRAVRPRTSGIALPAAPLAFFVGWLVYRSPSLDGLARVRFDGLVRCHQPRGPDASNSSCRPVSASTLVVVHIGSRTSWRNWGRHVVEQVVLFRRPCAGCCGVWSCR